MTGELLFQALKEEVELLRQVPNKTPHLLAIYNVLNRVVSQAELRAKRLDEQHNEIMNEINPLGQN